MIDTNQKMSENHRNHVDKSTQMDKYIIVTCSPHKPNESSHHHQRFCEERVTLAEQPGGAGEGTTLVPAVAKTKTAVFTPAGVRQDWRKARNENRELDLLRKSSLRNVEQLPLWWEHGRLDPQEKRKFRNLSRLKEQREVLYESLGSS